MKARFFFPWRTYITFVYLCAFFQVTVGSLFALFFGVETASRLPQLALFVALGSFLGAFVFFIPLRRILLKAIRLSNKGRVWGLIRDEDKFFKSTRGVFREFDVALNLIRQKLKRRGMQLAHEREEAETIMTFLEDALVSFAPDGRIKYFNSRFAHLFFPKTKLAKGASPENLYVHEVTNDSELNALFRNVFEEKSLLRTQFSRTDPDRYYSVLVSPLRDERSQVIYGAVALFHDISELKRVERMRLEFVENASHELRTPLTSIKGFLATVREDFQQERLEQIPHFLNIVSKNVDRLGDLVGDMLTLSKLENQSNLQRAPISPAGLTADVIERLTPLATEKNICLMYSSELAEFSGDEEKVERVLLNLVGNAIKYIGDHGIIDVKWTLSEQTARLSVHDNGPGIPPEHLGRLFERFYRIDKGRSREVGGTGLGLSIVKHIMQTHGGRVYAESTVGKGSTFVCEFPISP